MGQSNDAIDWLKAGTRLRRTPQEGKHGGRNPDWNWVAKRWKTAAEYAGEEMTAAEVQDRVPCPQCDRLAGLPCKDARDRDMDYPHEKRRVVAGAERVKAGEFTL